MEGRKQKSRMMVTLYGDDIRRYIETKNEKQRRAMRSFPDSDFIAELMRIGMTKLEKRYGLVTPKKQLINESSNNL